MNQTMPAVAADETFDGTWPFRARYSDAPSFAMHYVDEGARPETFLLLHGEPTWGYLFRRQIPVWAARHRVIAVDHMGFGKSAAPQDRTYWLQDHIDNLERFVLALDLRDLTLVMHDFGGPVGMGLAIRHPDRIKCVVAVNGPTPAGQPDLIDRITANVAVAPWFQWILMAEKEGVLEHVLGQLDYNYPLDAQAKWLPAQRDHYRHLDAGLQGSLPHACARGRCHWLGHGFCDRCARVRSPRCCNQGGACKEAGAGGLGRRRPDAPCQALPAALQPSLSEQSGPPPARCRSLQPGRRA